MCQEQDIHQGLLMEAAEGLGSVPLPIWGDPNQHLLESSPGHQAELLEGELLSTAPLKQPNLAHLMQLKESSSRVGTSRDLVGTGA